MTAYGVLLQKARPDIRQSPRAERPDRRARIGNQKAGHPAGARAGSQIPQRPPLRSEALPRAPEKTAAMPTTKPAEPVFEEINRAKLTPRAEVEVPELFNELGVRKYDLPALFNRWRNHLRGPTTSNPRLVNYLAAGGVHGLRPLRYEKRVARNRFILLVIIVTVVLFGLFAVFLPRH